MRVVKVLMILASIHLTSCTLNSKSSNEGKLSSPNELVGVWSICSWGTYESRDLPNVCPKIHFKEGQIAELNIGDTQSVFVWEQFGSKVFITAKANQKTTFFRNHSRFEFSTYEESEIKYLELKVIGSDFQYFLSTA